MNPAQIVTAVGGVLNLITMVLPLVGVDNSAAISGIVKTVTDIAPLAISQIGATYTGFKNILAAIGDHPATTEEQLATLDAFDKQADDAWDAVESKLDPDIPGNV